MLSSSVKFKSNSIVVALLCRFYLFCGWQDHHDAVEKDGDDDDEGEEGVDEDVDGDPAHRGEGGEKPHRVLRRKAENVFAFAYHHKGLKIGTMNFHMIRIRI